MSEEKENPHVELIKAVTALSAKDQSKLFDILQHKFDDPDTVYQLLKRGYERSQPIADLILDSDIDPSGAILTFKVAEAYRYQFVVQLDGEPKTFGYKDAEELYDWLEDFLVDGGDNAANTSN